MFQELVAAPVSSFITYVLLNSLQGNILFSVVSHSLIDHNEKDSKKRTTTTTTTTTTSQM
jgi:hypothetical protein